MKPLRSILIYLGLGSLPAAAQTEDWDTQDTVYEADLQNQLGKIASERHDYEAAIYHFLLSNRLVSNPNVEYNLGMTYEVMERWNEAFHHYSNALRLSHDPELLEEIPSKLEQLRKQCALLNLQTDPPGAKLYIDRKDLGLRGTTPLTLALPEGDHQIIVEHEGYRPIDPQPVKLVQGKEQKLQLTLQRILVPVRIDLEPEDAVVFMEGQSQPLQAQDSVFLLPPGNYALIVQAPGYKDHREPLLVFENEPLQFPIKLDPQRGRVKITSNPSPALVYIDGIGYGQTPIILDELTLGQHEIRIASKDHFDDRMIVQLKPDTTLPIHAELCAKNATTIETHMERSPHQKPVSYDLISKHEIEVFGYESVYDALLGSRGVSGNNKALNPILYLRGMPIQLGDSAHYLLTLDGHRISEDLVGGMTPGRGFLTSLGDVKRIELNRGAISSFEGANATAGAIHVQTHDNISDVPIQLEVAQPEDRALRGRVAGSQSLGSWGHFWLSLESFQSQGDDPSMEQNQISARSPSIRQKAEYDTHINGQLQLRRLKVHMLYKHQEHDLLWMEGASDAEQKGINYERHHSVLDASYLIYRSANLQSQLSAISDYDHVESDLASQNTLTAPYHMDWKSLLLGFKWDTIAATTDRSLFFKGGIEAQRFHLGHFKLTPEDKNWNDLHAKDALYSLYAQIRYSVLTPLTLEVSGRLDYSDQHAFVFSPHASLLYTPTLHDHFKLLYGQSYHSRNFFERHARSESQSSEEEAHLKFEQTWSSELEYRHLFPLDVILTTALFYSQTRNLTLLKDKDQIWVNRSYASAEDKLYSLGGEFEIKKDWWNHWFFSANYSYQRTRFDSLTGGEPLSNAPNHLVSFKLAVPITPVGIIMANRLRYESPYALPNMGSSSQYQYYWDLTLTGISPMGDHFHFAVGIRNLLNSRQPERIDSDNRRPEIHTEGRSMYLKLKGTL